MNANTDTIALILSKISDAHARVRYMDRLGLKKGDLVTAAAARGLSTVGTRSAIAYRIARN